jgi:hypothetical protein
MDFAAYYETLTPAEKREIAATLETSALYLSHIARGRKRLSLGMALAIVAASGSVIKADDLPLTERARAQLALIRAAKRKPPKE